MLTYRTKSFWFICDRNPMTAPVRCFAIKIHEGRYCLSREDLYRQSPFTVDQIDGARTMKVVTHIDSFTTEKDAIDAAGKMLDLIIRDMRKMNRWHTG